VDTAGDFPSHHRLRTIRLPAHVIESLNRLNRERRTLSAELGREADLRYLAIEWKMPVQVELLLESSRAPASPDAPIGATEDTSIDHLVRDTITPSPEELLMHERLADD
jgi:RNA polymerase primary sigma factor